MSVYFQCLALLLLALVVVWLIPVLTQLKRTAASLERLAESARLDLASMSRDVHQARRRLDATAAQVQELLSAPRALGRLAQDLAGRVRDIADQASAYLRRRAPPSWLQICMLLAGGFRDGFGASPARSHPQAPGDSVHPEDTTHSSSAGREGVHV